MIFDRPPSSRHDPATFDREVQRLFRQRPNVIGHSSELATPGSYLTEWLAGLPVLVVRQPDGTLRGFLNLCLH